MGRVAASSGTAKVQGWPLTRSPISPPLQPTFMFGCAGHIVTNFHVIKGASDIKVALIDQSVFPATVSSQSAHPRLYLHLTPV